MESPGAGEHSRAKTQINGTHSTTTTASPPERELKGRSSIKMLVAGGPGFCLGASGQGVGPPSWTQARAADTGPAPGATQGTEAKTDSSRCWVKTAHEPQVLSHTPGQRWGLGREKAPGSLSVGEPTCAL